MREGDRALPSPPNLRDHRYLDFAAPEEAAVCLYRVLSVYQKLRVLDCKGVEVALACCRVGERLRRRDPVCAVASMLLLWCVVAALFSPTFALSAEEREFSSMAVESGGADAATSEEPRLRVSRVGGTLTNPTESAAAERPEATPAALGDARGLEAAAGGLELRRLSAVPLPPAPAPENAHPESIPRHRGVVTGAAAAGLGAHAVISALKYGPQPRAPYPLVELAVKGFRLNTHNRGIYSFVAALVLFAFALKKFLRSRQKRQRWLLDEMLRQDRLRVQDLQAQQQAARVAALRNAARGGKK